MRGARKVGGRFYTTCLPTFDSRTSDLFFQSPQRKNTHSLITKGDRHPELVSGSLVYCENKKKNTQSMQSRMQVVPADDTDNRRIGFIHVVFGLPTPNFRLF